MGQTIKKSELGSVHFSQVFKDNVSVTEETPVDFLIAAGLSCVLEDSASEVVAPEDNEGPETETQEFNRRKRNR
jgi:hypothetical protein